MNDKVKAIESLAKLLDQGKISETEFRRLKNEVLTRESVSVTQQPSDHASHPGASPSPSASSSWLARIPLAAWIMGGLGFIVGVVRSDVLGGLVGGLLWVALVTGLVALYRWLKRELTAKQLLSSAGFGLGLGFLSAVIQYAVLFWGHLTEGPGLVNHPPSWSLGLVVAVAVFAYRSSEQRKWWSKKPMPWLYSDKN